MPAPNLPPSAPRRKLVTQSPSRASAAELEQRVRALTADPIVQVLLDAAGVSVMVLNQHRQILVGSENLLSELGVSHTEAAEGLRPGELLGCIHANEHADGCGAASACKGCGSAQAIKACKEQGTSIQREFLLSVERGGHLEARELTVKASPLVLGGEAYTVLGLRDISAEKRRETLERVFLHDLSNTVGTLLLQASEFVDKAPMDLTDAALDIKFLVNRLRREIEDQRTLLQAERGSLELRRTQVRPRQVLDIAERLLQEHPVAKDRVLEITPARTDKTVLTDESLVVRGLVNMLKNALEATARGGTVRAWVEIHGDACEFHVWNAGEIEPLVATQIFKRSFSTKPGRGRGLGTFSMKLFAERYLGGTVGFSSTESAGTTFFLRLPLEPSA